MPQARCHPPLEGEGRRAASEARCEPGWGEFNFLVARSPHPDASLSLSVDPPPPGEGEERPTVWLLLSETSSALPRLLIHIDFHRAREDRAPGPQIGLHPRIAGHALAIELHEFGGVVFDLLHEASGVVDVLQQAHAPAAERLV